MHKNETILFFDGVCGLCNGLVDWLILRDHHCHIKFAPLQGTTAKQLLPGPYAEDLATVVLWHRGKILIRSEAILCCLGELGGLWRGVALLRLVPLWLRDLLYRWIARHRYQWFGHRTTCRLPGPGERLRFLD